MSQGPVPSGKYHPIGDHVDCFVPAPLPPELDLSSLIPLISEASNLIGNLNGLGQDLRNPALLIKPQLLKEAVLSSKIEGTQVSLSDMYYYHVGAAPATKTLANDSEEVDNYVDALEEGLRAMTLEEDRSLDLDLILRCHDMLLRGVRGQDTIRGELRTQQNYIGPPLAKIEDAKYVPPAPEFVPKLMENLFQFIDNPPRKYIPVIQCAIIHYQFEAIHPFEDGNGRIGRLLIPLLLADRRLLVQPLLYLSEFFERNKTEYYEMLNRVSTNSDWIPWIRFVLSAIISQAKATLALINQLRDLRKEYLRRTERISHLSSNITALIDLLFEIPIISRSIVADRLKVTKVTAVNIVNKAVDLGILEYAGVYNTRKIYVARELHDLLDQ